MGIGQNGGGIATVRFFADLGWNVIATDLKTADELNMEFSEFTEYQNISWKLGVHDPKDFISADIIVKNPAVPLENKYISLAKEREVSVVNDAELFLLLTPKEKIIGVTGTKGKTTTTLLITHLLKENFTAVAVGVPGTSFFDIFYLAHIPDYIVAEFSSFDCELLTMSPHIAVLTSLFPDHLNRHGNFAEYVKAKSRLFATQESTDILFLPHALAIESVCPGRKIFFGEDLDIETAFDWTIHTNSIFAAAAVAHFLGILKATLAERLSTFIPPIGRREVTTLKSGVTLINDTTSTTPRAAVDTITAIIKQFPEKKVFAIIGGEDKNFPPEEIELLNELLKNISIEILILPGTLSDQIVPGVKVATLKEAALHIKKFGGDVVALVPGAASFNMFVNEFDRGEKFVSTMINYL